MKYLIATDSGDYYTADDPDLDRSENTVFRVDTIEGVTEYEYWDGGRWVAVDPE